MEQVKVKRREREAMIHEAMAEIKEHLDEQHIKCEIQGRPKNFYSIYKKMQRDHKELSEIYDLLVGDKSIREVSDITGFSQTTISKYRKIVTERDAKANLQASPNASRASSKKSSPTPSSTDSKDGADTDAPGPAK